MLLIFNTEIQFQLGKLFWKICLVTECIGFGTFSEAHYFVIFA